MAALIVSPYDFLICDANHDRLGLLSQFKNGNITGIINRLASGCNFRYTNNLICKNLLFYIL